MLLYPLAIFCFGHLYCSDYVSKTLSRGLPEKVRNKMANAQERKRALLEVLGFDSFCPEKFAEVVMKEEVDRAGSWPCAQLFFCKYG